jgi:hypothetical protein
MVYIMFERGVYGVFESGLQGDSNCGDDDDDDKW